MWKKEILSLSLSRRNLLQAIGVGFTRLSNIQLEIDAYQSPDMFLHTTEEELSRFVTDPEGNLKERERVKGKIDQLVPLFAEDAFHNLSGKEIQEDLDIYFDMYWAGWEKYQIPWALLWIIHIQESLVSRDLKADFNGDGALQVTRDNIENPQIKSAPEGYRNLEEKTQRFSVRGGRRTTDSNEILHGAAYIRVVVNEKKRTEDDEQDVLKVVHFSYSAEVFGEQRVRKYQQIKKILEAKDTSVLSNSNAIIYIINQLSQDLPDVPGSID